MLRLENVTKKFYKHNALEDVSFKVDSGEFIFLTGPSGAGKTTVLRLIIRDLLPSKGTIILDDFNIVTLPQNKIPHLRRKVGMIFQDFKILTDRTIFENVAVALEIIGLKDAQIESRVGKVLEMVGLERKKNLFPLQLSAGELQRTAIARAIVGKPSLLLADEPTGNLDPKTGWEILKVLKDINKEGTSIIMATHNVDVVNSLDLRVIKVVDGKVVKDEKKGKYS